jgi:hypothetical protein
MSDAVSIRLWYVRETKAAYLYTTVPPDRHPSDLEELWVPKSIVEGRTKRGDEHEVRLPDWWIRAKGL